MLLLIAMNEYDNRYADRRSGTLKLAHFSVKEYLIRQQVLSGVALNLPTAEQLSHSMIAQTCVAYLLHFDRPDSLSYNNLASFPMAHYAANYWQLHLIYVRLEFAAAATLQKLLQHLLHPPPSYAMLNWLRLYNPEIPWGGINFDNTFEHFASPLYYACCWCTLSCCKLYQCRCRC